MVVFFHGLGATLARDVRDRQRLPDQISYFYLHGKTSDIGSAGETPAFFIGAEPITANDLKAWAEWGGRKGVLPGNPLMLFGGILLLSWRR